ncbi:MAG: hypothetical protein GYA35_08295, partial [Thermoanaerobaculaceae bacterium]|nr:hypothetical protein [Thermoanaerobaculaceae bacterium]
STGGLFLLVGIVYERTHTRLIKEYGGLAKLMPVYAAFFMVITLSSIGLPGLNGFVGEILVLLGAYHMSAAVFSKSLLFFLVSGMVLGAAYMLWMYQRVFFGEVRNPHLEEHTNGKDMNLREIGYMTPLVILALWIGLYPAPVLNRMEPSIKFVLDRVTPVVVKIEIEKGLKSPVVEHSEWKPEMLPQPPAEEGQPVNEEQEKGK